MKKIVELIVNLDDIELEGTGVDAIALVENPAIELDFLAFKQERDWFVDNKGMEQFKEFLDSNVELFKKPGGGQHGAEMQRLSDAGISTEYPFGYCFQIAQFVFYALGGYESDWDLMCIKGMEYTVQDIPFSSTHWYVQNKKNGRIVDLSAEQFDGILDINQYYGEGRRANLGFPYYNVEGQKIEFENTVPSMQTLKLYGKWIEDNEELEGIQKFYDAAKYKELRQEFSFEDLPYREEFVEPRAGEDKDEFISRCIPVVLDEGYAEDQAIAICYSYWENKEFEHGLAPYTEPLKEKDREEMSEEQLWVLSELEKMGTEYDPMETYVIDAQRASFSTLQDFLKGIAAIDILGKNKKKDEEGETVYRYAGPTAERGFCRAMLRLNKLYRREEIERLNSANPGFGRRGSSTYDVFEYKGGPSCRHFWEELTMFKNDQNQTVLISNGPVPMSVNQNAGKSNNMNSPSSQGSVANNAYVERRNFSFSIDEEQRVVVGPAMIPHKMILRKDENGNPYYVYFTEKTIRDISEDYFQEYKHNNTNVEHNSAATNDKNTLLESWIVEDPERDKAAALGFSVPRGAWMVSYKINDDETWNQIKEGKLKGFSVEGYFVEKADAMQKVEDTYQEILDILGQIDL